MGVCAARRALLAYPVVLLPGSILTRSGSGGAVEQAAFRMMVKG